MGTAKRVSQLISSLPNIIAREIIVTRPRRLSNSDSTTNYNSREIRRKTKAGSFAVTCTSCFTVARRFHLERRARCSTGRGRERSLHR